MEIKSWIRIRTETRIHNTGFNGLDRPSQKNSYSQIFYSRKFTDSKLKEESAMVKLMRQVY
jgi:hypothetical protein